MMETHAVSIDGSHEDSFCSLELAGRRLVTENSSFTAVVEVTDMRDGMAWEYVCWRLNLITIVVLKLPGCVYL